jgi:hypothetical protein
MCRGCCPFSVLLCNFDICDGVRTVMARSNQRETKTKKRNTMGHDGIRIAHLVAVSPTLHMGIARRRTGSGCNQPGERVCAE